MSQRKYKSIVILTGAGISAESGIKTFRDSGGLWENHKIEDVATPEGFLRNPELVYEFYNQRRRQLLSNGVKPNKAHEALVKLEADFAGQFLLITQNVDNLHERAGSKNLVHMHGELLKAQCLQSEEVFECNLDLNLHTPCLCCQPPYKLRPHIVWFGEMPLNMDQILYSLSACDLFVSIGTSGNVYPAAGFAKQAAHAGAHTVELNLEPSETRTNFTESIYGLASEVVPKYINSLLNICRD